MERAALMAQAALDLHARQDPGAKAIALQAQQFRHMSRHVTCLVVPPALKLGPAPIA